MLTQHRGILHDFTPGHYLCCQLKMSLKRTFIVANIIVIPFTVNYVRHVKHIYNTEIYNSITLLLLCVLSVRQNQMCIFVHAHSAAAAVSIEIIFATKTHHLYIVYILTSSAREQNIIGFNKCCSCVISFCSFSGLGGGGAEYNKLSIKQQGRLVEYTWNYFSPFLWKLQKSQKWQ